MRTLALVVPLGLLAGCYVRATPYAAYSPAPAAPSSQGSPQAEVYYYGNHFVPEGYGGGWCYADGPHTHDYVPDRDDYYDYDQGYFWYRGPFVFSFFGGHPLPGGGWCFLDSGHNHDYFPPSGADWQWSRTGYVYSGQYHSRRPPPVSYWSRPAPRPDYRNQRPAVRPSPASARRPTRDDVRPPPSSGRDRDVRPAPRPDDDRRATPDARPSPGHSGDAPGHGNLPPGHGGTPPGQTRPDVFDPPGRSRPEASNPGRPDRRGPAPTPPPNPSFEREKREKADDDKKSQSDKREQKSRDDKDESSRSSSPRRR